AGVKRHRRRIVEIEDGDVPRALPGNDVLLRGDIRVAGPVMVDVILEHVRDDGDVRAVPERFELEARELEDDDVLAPKVIDLLDDRCPDVAAYDDAPRARCENALDEGGRRGLPLRPGDPDDRGRAEPEEEGHLRE